MRFPRCVARADLSGCEVLAPAGGFDSLIAAVRSGANAVYLGGKTLNARRNAGNFDDSELEKAIKYCHARNVRVYLTLNTLVSDSEIPEAIKLIERACAIGADALILQDLGLAEIVRYVSPEMPMHASTQMSVQTPAGMALLEDVGFVRAVLPRELSKGEIEAISHSSSLELEAFVHGALCMSVSGQCYLSALLGSRSGNRGLCAQPCRLPFSVNSGTGNDLSLKDLSLIEELPQLASAGVSSFKIEGRMKRPEYVAAAVTACRASLDGELSADMLDALRSVFSRSGFTKGYYLSSLGRDMFGTRTKQDVESAAPKVLSSLQRLYDRETELVGASLSLSCCVGEPLSLRAGAMGKEVEASSSSLVQQALKRETSQDEMREQLSKCGGTQFFAKDINITAQSGAFVPASQLNSLRRDALEKLDSLLSSPEPKKYNQLENLTLPPHMAGKMKTYMQFSDVSEITIEAYSKADLIIVPLNTSADKLREILLAAGESGNDVCVDIPRGIFGSSDAVVKKLRAAHSLGINRALVGTLDALRLARNDGFDIICGVGMNVYNSRALHFLEEQGASQALVSFELTLGKAEHLGGNLERGFFAYGRLPLMLTRNCPARNGQSCAECQKKGCLTDRKGIQFPIDCSSGCSEILNSVPLYMADRLNEAHSMDFMLLRFTTENKAQIKQIISAYESALPPTGEFTRGLYYRGNL